MADLFNKHIKKATSRTKEKLLEGIGKAKATQDEAFDFHAANLNKQAKACERLHKDLKTYSETLKKLTDAEKALNESIRQAYEPEWPDREHVVALSNTLDIQAEELEKRVSDDLLASVTAYVGQFNDLKKKVDKRGRKLVDYDHAKNSYNSIKASSKKGESDPKLTKAFAELQQAETMYKEINNELLEILPATYDSRITFFVDTLQNLFNAQSSQQAESAKLHKQLVTQLDTLGNSMDGLRVARPEALSTTPTRDDSPTRSDGGLQPSPQPAGQPSPAPSAASSDTPAPAPPTAAKRSTLPAANVEEKADSKLYPKLGATPGKGAEEAKEEEKKDESKKMNKSLNPFDDDDGQQYEVLEVNTKPFLKTDGRKVLYTVLTTHEYKAQDEDEMDFPPGIKIKVLETTTEDNLDEGWQLGAKDDGTTGVFPENFTKKIPEEAK